MTNVSLSTHEFVQIDGETGVKTHTINRQFQFRHEAINWLLTSGLIVQEGNKYSTPTGDKVATLDSRTSHERIRLRL